MPLMDEAVVWRLAFDFLILFDSFQLRLRHNSMCEAQPPQRVSDLEDPSCGWWPERELVEGIHIFVCSH